MNKEAKACFEVCGIDPDRIDLPNRALARCYLWMRESGSDEDIPNQIVRQLIRREIEAILGYLGEQEHF